MLDLTLSCAELPFRLPLTTARRSRKAKSMRGGAGVDDGDDDDG